MSPAYNTAREDLAPLLEALGFEARRTHLVDAAVDEQNQDAQAAGPGHVLVAQIGNAPRLEAAVSSYRTRCDARLAHDGALLFLLKDPRPDAELARWRNALWPWVHVVALVRLDGGATVRTLDGAQPLEGVRVPRRGDVLVCRRREHVLAPDATTLKFDTNAAGWNVRPGERGWSHYIWMRRLVGTFHERSDARRILDFGSGAGWVGIEAWKRSRGASLAAFDPSPAMVANAEANARAAGVTDFEGRTGFGEDPPFPAEGEERFDLVLSSGVISFSPDHERWLDGLLSTAAPGATVVVGDIHPESRGMLRRKRAKPLLPARELNGLTPDAMRARLEARGLRLEAVAGYQLTHPLPPVMHVSDTRLGGLLTPLCLGLNRLAVGRLGAAHFDSWVLRFRAP